MTFNRSSLVLFGLGLAGAAYMLRPRRAVPTVTATESSGPVRDAGREEMTMPPRRWDMQDEALDQTFPASDPPGNY